MSDIITEYSLYGEIDLKIDEYEEGSNPADAESIANEIVEELPESLIEEWLAKTLREAVDKRINARKNRVIRKGQRTRSAKFEGAAETLSRGFQEFMQTTVKLPGGIRKIMYDCTVEDFENSNELLRRKASETLAIADRQEDLIELMTKRKAKKAGDLTEGDVKEFIE